MRTEVIDGKVAIETLAYFVESAIDGGPYGESQDIDWSDVGIEIIDWDAHEDYDIFGIGNERLSDETE